MASVRVCDRCEDKLTPPYLRIVVKEVREGQESRNYPTAKSMDLHKGCFDELLAVLERKK